MPQEEICYHEKSQLEAQMKVEKPHKTSFYKDKKDGFIYCGICEEKLATNGGLSREFTRLIESKRHYVSTRIGYPSDKAKPLRHNQRITDEHLKSEFEKIEGKYLDVADLKFLWGPSYGNPKGFIEINDSDRSTTVVSSNYLRRLSKITRFKWTQQRAEGENKEKLVIFRKTEESWKDPRKRAKEEQLEKLHLLDLEEKWDEKLGELEAELKLAREGIDPEMWDYDDIEIGVDYEFENKEEQENTISYLQYKIAKVQDALNQPITAYDDDEIEEKK